MPKTMLGEFEHQVILAIMRLGGDAYSVSIALELSERTGREVSQAAAFIVLRRLEEKGLLTSRFDHGAVVQTGRVRRYFKPTREAMRRLRESRRTLLRLWDGIEAIVDEVAPESELGGT